MTHHRLACTALALGSVALLAACTSGSGDSQAASAAGSAVAAAPSRSAAAGGAQQQAARLSSPTALIVTGSMSLTVPGNAAVDRAATRAAGIADAAGGRVDDDSRSGGARHSATLVLRVPNAALSGVRAQLATLGTVRSQELQTKDVTSQVADVNSRVGSARAAIAALNRLYAKARTVHDLISVESSLATRQSNLEALEAQQRTLGAQTALATLTLSIDVRAPAVVRHHRHAGFTGGLRSGWDAFTASARALATATGAVLPFAALALLVGAGGLLVVRRRRQTSPAAADPS